MHYDDDDMRARWAQTQADGEAVAAYLAGPVADYTYRGPDHEAVTVMVSGGIDGDQPGTVVPGSVTYEHGFPKADVIFDDGSTFGFHTARLAPYTPLRYAENPGEPHPDHVTIMCAVCQP